MNRALSLVVLAAAAAALAACDRDAGNPYAGDRALTTDTVMNHFDVSVAPDGRLVYSKPVNGAAAIFVADSNGENPRQITNGVWDFGPRWSPDGKWIAFGRETGGFDVLVVSADSGAAREVAAGPGPERPLGWLADVSGIVFARYLGSRTEIWVYRLADGTSERLLDFEGDATASPSPDGRWLAYDLLRDGQRTIWTFEIATSQHRQLTTDGYEFFPDHLRVWSGDSRHVVYISGRSGTRDIWSVDVTTGENRQLTRDVRDDYHPVYSPDGRRVLFISNRGGQTDVWMVADTGGAETRVTNDTDEEFAATWTADGTGVIVLANGAYSRLYSVSSDSAAPRQLTEGESHAFGFGLAPGQRRIVYEMEQGGEMNIYSMPIDGGDPVVVTSSPTRDFSPSVSPDGNRVAFVSRRTGNSEIYVTPLAGGPAVQLTNSASEDQQPAWSPDGRWIAFVSNRASPGDLYLMDSAGKGVRRLTSLGVVNAPVGAPPHQWSPDGRKLLFTGRAASAGPGVFTVEIATGKVTAIVPESAVDAAWSPDGTQIATAAYSQGYASIELRTADGQLIRTLSGEGKVYDRLPQFSPDGSQIAFRHYEFATDFYHLAVVPVAGGAIRRVGEIKGTVQKFEWLPGGEGMIFSGQQYKMKFYRRTLPPEQDGTR
jgi:Tol biopolymer transport system component